MSSEKAAKPNLRKRQLSVGVELGIESPPPSAKRRKLENQQRHKTPSWFWDNLSRLWLTRRTLREFDRRTVSPATPLPPNRTGKGNIHLVQLKRFAKHGGPSLSDLRAYSEPEIMARSNRAADSSQSGSRKRAKSGRESNLSTKTRKSSAYDPGFEQHLIDHGIYPHRYHGNDDDNDSFVYPDNYKEILERLAQPRPSLSPSRFSREAFRESEILNMEALTENTVMSSALPIIAGSVRIPHSENLLFGNLKDLTDGSITKGQPDFYDGSRPAELNKKIRDDLGRYIVPSTNTAAPCVPNFFIEGKGPNGNPAVCKRQALHDGALGARGIHKLRTYINPETVHDNNAYTIPSTYNNGLLRLYSIHPTPSTKPDIPIKYRMTQLRGWDMTDSPDTFREGASALRNAREWTKEKREEFIAAANLKAQNPDHSGLELSTQSFESLSSNEPTHPESETSTDELAADGVTFVSPDHRTRVGPEIKKIPKVLSNPRSKKRPVNKVDGMGLEASQVI